MIIYALIFSETESPNSPRAISSKLRLVGKPTPASYNLKSKSDIEGKTPLQWGNFAVLDSLLFHVLFVMNKCKTCYLNGQGFLLKHWQGVKL